MKKYLFTFALFFCCALHAVETSTNLLSIHLVVTNVDLYASVPLGTLPCFVPMPKPTDLKLVSPPVLADTDFVFFNITNQTFAITPEAAKRLSKQIWKVYDSSALEYTPDTNKMGLYLVIPSGTKGAFFVLKAEGEPIYVGAFFNKFSSEIISGPTIKPEDEFISTDLTNNVTFSIHCYPLPDLADPRRDSRIATAVRKLFSHGKQ